MQILERTVRSPSARAAVTDADLEPYEPIEGGSRYDGTAVQELVAGGSVRRTLWSRRAAIWGSIAVAGLLVLGIVAWRQLDDGTSGDSLATCDRGSAAACGDGTNLSAGDRKFSRGSSLRHRRNRAPVTTATTAPATDTTVAGLLSTTPQVSPPTVAPSTAASATAAPTSGASTSGASLAAPPAGVSSSTTAAPTSTAPAAKPAAASTSPTAAPTTPTTKAPTTVATTVKTTTPPAPAAGSDAGRSGCWVPVMFDGFDGSAVDASKWDMYHSPGNSNHGLRRESAISVGGGVLTITAQMVNGTLVSGGMAHKFSQAYGRYEARVRTSRDPSMSTSAVVLTFPSSNVHPRDGENDIYDMPPEKVGVDRTSFYTFIHKPFGTVHDQEWVVHPVSALDWHTVALEWTPSQMRLYRDGVLVRTIDETSADLIPDVKHFLAIQLDPWQDSLPEPVWMQVDYAKVESPC